MNVIDTRIADVKLIEPNVFGDQRGFFMETWNAATFRQAGLDLQFVQDNHAKSGKGVLRGMHYQLQQPQGKLVRVAAGSVFDVVVDMRRSSATFGKWVGAELSAENKRMLWAPPGMAHGYLSLEEGTEFLYKCTDFYAPACERSLLWNDPEVGIVWPFGDIITPLLSAKDEAGQPLAVVDCFP